MGNDSYAQECLILYHLLSTFLPLILSQLTYLRTFTEIQLNIYVWVCLWTLHSVPLIHIHIILINCIFLVNSEIGHLVLSKNYFDYSRSFVIHENFATNISISI